MKEFQHITLSIPNRKEFDIFAKDKSFPVNIRFSVSPDGIMFLRVGEVGGIKIKEVIIDEFANSLAGD